MSNYRGRSELNVHQILDEDEFLKDGSFDDLVRQRVRLEKDTDYRRKRYGARRQTGKKGVAPSTGRRKVPSAPKPTRIQRPYVQSLLIKGEITADLYRASLDYEQAFMAITGQLGFCVSKLEPKRDRSWQGMDESTRRIILQHAYAEWRQATSKRSQRVMYDVLIDHKGIKEMEKELGARSGGVKKALITGLKDFAKAKTLVLRRADHFVSVRSGHVEKKSDNQSK